MNPAQPSDEPAASLDRGADLALLGQLALETSAGFAIIGLDPKGVIVSWNRGAEALFGYPPDAVKGQDFALLFRQIDVANGVPRRELANANRSGIASDDCWLVRQDGSEFWASGINTAMRDASGTLRGFCKTIRDATERKQLRAALNASEEKFQTTISVIEDHAIFSADAEGKIATWNASCEAVLGSTATEVRGDRVEQFLRAADASRFSAAAAMQQAANEGVISSEASFLRANGDSFRAQVIVIATHDGQKAPLGFTFVIRDLTVRDRADRAVRTSLQRLTLVSETAQALLKTADPLALLDRIFERLALAFGLDFYFHYVVDERSSKLRLRACRGLEPTVAACIQNMDAEATICQEVANTRRPVVVNDIQRSVDPKTQLVRELGVAAYACYPLMGDSALFGTLSFGVRHRTEFHADELEVFSAMAHLFSEALTRDQVARALRRSERKLHFLNQLGEATRPLTDPAQIMALVTREVGERLGVSRCAYADVDFDNEQFTIPQDYANGVPSSLGKYQLSTFGETVKADLLRGQTLVLRNVDRELGPFDGRAAFAALKIQAIICCPLVKDSQLRAMMAVHQDQPRDWTTDEIELLEAVVERCWSTIERARAEEALRQSEKRLKLAMEAGRLGMWSLDTSRKSAMMDERVAELFGFAPNTRMTSLNEIIERIHPDDREVVRQSVQHALEGGTHYDAEFRAMLPNGGIRWLAGKGDRVRDPITGTVELIGVNYDLTPHKRVEEELHATQIALRQHADTLETTIAERTAELRETVSELERFSYSLSHDMRAPLRAMQGFAEVLQEEYGDRLDDQARGYLKRIVSAAARLDQLIRDVLSYTHVVREEIRLQPIALEPILRQLILENPALQPPQAEIHLAAPLEPVLGHEAYLTQCLSNLLSNAVKFVAPGNHPIVRVWTAKREGGVRIYVHDNGIGIPPEWQSRIFGMFERMHPASHYAGTGIGLTIVRKAAERMGGRVGLESEPGQGSTFWVQLRGTR